MPESIRGQIDRLEVKRDEMQGQAQGEQGEQVEQVEQVEQREQTSPQDQG
ncbi:MAG: hypothetical protein ACLFTD_06690 [Halochromatium sp.]